MDENFSHMRGHLENIHNILSTCSQKFDDAQEPLDLTVSLADKCKIEEVTKPDIISALNEEKTNPICNLEVHSKMLEVPFHVEQENSEDVDTYL
ncbi:hypothetical protein R3W88_008154 [Solanum pinnatisectum]|uniref:Uncharacterized protein n=1 Tax=Solanum pinnatisectum TaxID=50273 RepID=A0AAV9M826_9SOLN|nr:hypothetical protein R3W88_008154 [Solanum pinnatisectum]